MTKLVLSRLQTQNITPLPPRKGKKQTTLPLTATAASESRRRRVSLLLFRDSDEQEESSQAGDHNDTGDELQ